LLLPQPDSRTTSKREQPVFQLALAACFSFRLRLPLSRPSGHFPLVS
jgi:hypothetical protein